MSPVRPRRDDRSKERGSLMSMQTGQDHSGFFCSAAGQTTLLLLGSAIVLAVGWVYVW